MKALQRAIVLVFVATSGFAQDVARMEQVVQAAVQDKTFMGSVLVARGGEVVLSKGYGSANLEWDIPNSPSTRFRLGSITKQFTAASILLLEERGRLKIDDPTKKHLPDTPPAWDKITIYNLLTHTSGIPNFTSSPDYKSLQPFESPVEQTIATFRDKPLDFEPGEKMSYSNSGYLVLGHLIEKITGGTYEKFLQDNIFIPLGMTDSGYDSNRTIIPRRAAGYSPSPNGRVNAAFIHMSIPHAAGALYSTTEDLLRWEQALFGGKVISAASLQKMTTPFKNDYAFGLVVRTENGRKVFWHNGGIDGFNTALGYYPETKVTVAVLANLNGRAPEQIGAKLAALAHGDAVSLTSERKEISVPVDVLARYVGTYQLLPGIDLMITLDGDRLMSQLSGQRKSEMFAESETRFFVRAVDAQVDFVKDGSGAVTHLVLHQNGRDMTAARASMTVVEPQHKEITLPVATLARYVGTYQMRPSIELSITLDGNQLMAQLTGQPKFPIFAESETGFYFKIVEATLEFQKDPGGAVTAVRLRQGRIDELGPRR